MKPAGTTAFYNILILTGIALVVFYPLFYTHYSYLDENFQIWLFRNGSSYRLFTPQGRYLSDMLFLWLYGSIDRFDQLVRLRVFSLLGWIISLPVWYYIFMKVSRKEGLSPLLPFYTLLYLITCPFFCISVGWAACMEFFIAHTAGLIAGYIVYRQLTFDDNKVKPAAPAIILSLIFGLISLFFYQNSFGCFLLPFLLHLIARKEVSRTVITGVVTCLLIYVVYFLLFRWQLHVFQTAISIRAEHTKDPFSKLRFFFCRPLATAFHFTWIVSEYSKIGMIIHGLTFCVILMINFFKMRAFPVRKRFIYLVAMMGFFLLIYLPSLIANENFASNRTLLALDLAVFVLVFTTVLSLIRQERRQLLFATVMGIFFVAFSWYNFRYQFLGPVKKEYDAVRTYIDSRYSAKITAVDFIRPPLDMFRQKYGITSSWDEFGVPSTHFDWVPASFVRQIIFEKTGNRPAADSLTITSRLATPGKISDAQPAPAASSGVLVVDVESIMLSDKTP